MARRADRLASAAPSSRSKYKDTYRDALCEIIKAKRKGEKIHVEREPESRRRRPT